jgi:hypothetical protein
VAEKGFATCRMPHLVLGPGASLAPLDSLQKKFATGHFFSLTFQRMERVPLPV